MSTHHQGKPTPGAKNNPHPHQNLGATIPAAGAPPPPVCSSYFSVLFLSVFMAALFGALPGFYFGSKAKPPNEFGYAGMMFGAFLLLFLMIFGYQTHSCNLAYEARQKKLAAS